MHLQTKHKIFIASLAFRVIRIARSITGKSLVGQFKRGDFTWELDLQEVVDFMIYISGSFEGDLNRFIAKNLGNGDIAMDIGANIGAHTLMMGKSVGQDGHVYAIEATEYAYKKLIQNIQLNPTIDAHITPTHSILSSKECQKRHIEIHSSWPFETNEQRHASHQGVFKTTGAAATTTLDQIVKTHGLQRLDMIKLDVDGNEWDVLSGAQETLSQLQPTILMEVAPDYHSPEDLKGFYNIHALLSELDYAFYTFKGQLLSGTAKEIANSIPNGASQNVVLVPKGANTPIFK
ncbi:MAG TPA: hypothetical protein DCX06_04510 [Opitutae bacterium]|nr:hypothetical protein [Opitutae bacterium]